MVGYKKNCLALAGVTIRRTKEHLRLLADFDEVVSSWPLVAGGASDVLPPFRPWLLVCSTSAVKVFIVGVSTSRGW
jgi:hypothetical protein